MNALREKLKEWLSATEPDLEVLGRWCQGYGLPLAGHADEPYLWIINAMPVGADEVCARAKLAAGAAILLNAHDDAKSIEVRSDQRLYNLLKLCAELNCPDELADPLYEIFQRKRYRSRIYDGVPLWNILLHAIAYNQADNRMESYWRQSLQVEDTILFLSFVGAIMTPRSADSRGEPHLDLIGYALKWMAVNLSGSSDRRPEFRRLIDDVRTTYLDWATFDADLLSQADAQDWPEWSVDCLPSLYIPKGEKRALLWHHMASAIPDMYHLEKKAELCKGQVVDALLDGAGAFVTSVAPVMERYRRQEEHPSDRAMLGAAVDALIEVQIAHPTNAALFEKARAKLLRQEEVSLEA